MDDYLESVCTNKEIIDKKAQEYASSYQEQYVQQALEHYEEEEAEILDMLDQDFHRQLHTEETVMEYATALYRVRRIVFYLRERFNALNGIDELMESFQSMNT